jgi:threonyl-tRNA synthetase
MVIHRSSIGAIERILAVLLEQNQGDLKTWLSPVQVKVLSFTDRNIKYSEKVIKQLGEEIPGLRIDSDFRNTTMQGKVKDAEMMKVPYIIVLGNKEEKENLLAVRTKGDKKIKNLDIGKFVENLKKEIDEKK